MPTPKFLMVIYRGNDPIIAQKTAQFGYGIAAIMGDMAELQFPDHSVFTVCTSELFRETRQFSDDRFREFVSAPEYVEPLVLPPRRFVEWCANKPLEEMYGQFQEAGFEEWQVLAMEYWRKFTREYMQEHGDFPNPVLASQMWVESKKRGRFWEWANHYVPNPIPACKACGAKDWYLVASVISSSKDRSEEHVIEDYYGEDGSLVWKCASCHADADEDDARRLKTALGEGNES